MYKKEKLVDECHLLKAFMEVAMDEAFDGWKNTRIFCGRHGYMEWWIFGLVSIYIKLVVFVGWLLKFNTNGNKKIGWLFKEGDVWNKLLSLISYN